MRDWLHPAISVASPDGIASATPLRSTLRRVSDMASFQHYVLHDRPRLKSSLEPLASGRPRSAAHSAGVHSTFADEVVQAITFAGVIKQLQTPVG